MAQIKFAFAPYTGPGIYRHFDAEGRLLYLGYAKNLMARLAGHSQRSHWRAEIHTVSVEPMDLLLASELEPRFIAAERPLYNRRGRGYTVTLKEAVKDDRQVITRQCVHCGISFETFNYNKIYCDDRCKANWHYHNRIRTDPIRHGAMLAYKRRDERRRRTVNRSRTAD